LRHITGSLTPELERHVGSKRPAQSEAFPISTFRELVETVARLAYLNKDHQLFFRGQARDFRNKANASTLYPTLYRGERVTRAQLDLGVALLESASSRLCEALRDANVEGHRDVKRRRYIQWSILQHYEVCATPLLDLTHSLRVACSFAYMSREDEPPYVFVLGMPYLTNRISVNSEHDLVFIRLLSICPPEALRPYFQEGYLAGTDEILLDFESKSELDFNNRLVAKFQLAPDRSAFWRGGFRAYPKKVLYPGSDRILGICKDLKKDLDTGLTAGRIGHFLELWTALEARIMTAARAANPDRRVSSVRAGLDVLRDSELLGPNLLERLHLLRQLRNSVVHRPDRVSNGDVAGATDAMADLMSLLESRPPWTT
jgi:uncharacterized protein YutE (UPF0331/DUF86 family)